jgi:polyisoprenyl-phosphate glycosyltransferase
MPEGGRRSLVLVAPVYNEEALLGEFLSRVRAAAVQAGLAGVVLVDDGSTDRTCEMVRRAASDDTLPVRLVRLSRNFGHQVAVLAGLAVACDWAERDGHRFVGVIDADLQDKPEDLAALMDAAEHAEVAYAVRASRKEGPLFRAFAGLFHRMLARHARFPIPRSAGTFSVMTVPVARVIVENAERAPFFPALRAWVGHRQVGVPLERDPRYAGTSRVGTMGLVLLALQALLGYSNLPLKLMALLSALTLSISAVAAVAIIALKLLGLVEVQGTALILTSVFFSLGVQSIYLLTLAYLMSRLSSESSHKKPYVVMTDEEVR